MIPFREEKSEQCVETQEELEETKEILAKLRNEVGCQGKKWNLCKIKLPCIVTEVIKSNNT